MIIHETCQQQPQQQVTHIFPLNSRVPWIALSSVQMTKKKVYPGRVGKVREDHLHR